MMRSRSRGSRRSAAACRCRCAPREAPRGQGPLQSLMQDNGDAIVKSSRRTIEPAIVALRDSGLPARRPVLEQWQERNLWVRKADGLFVIALPEGDDLAQTDIDTGASLGPLAKSDATQLKPNSGHPRHHRRRAGAVPAVRP